MNYVNLLVYPPDVNFVLTTIIMLGEKKTSYVSNAFVSFQ